MTDPAAPTADDFADRARRTLEEAGAPPPSSRLVPKRTPLLRFGYWAQPRVNRLLGRWSKVPDVPVQDTRTFPWVAEIESHWREIAEEARAALVDLDAVPPLATVSPDHRRIAPAGRWRSYFLIGYRYRIEANCRQCPRTAALVQRIPGLNSAFFSILAPRSHIPPHTGVTKAILTCHLGIQVPQAAECCTMRVVDRHLHWAEGRALVFDDTFNHEVMNDTDETRIVLLIQFRRPSRWLGRLVGWLFLTGVRHSRFVQEARAGVVAWHERVKA